VRACCKVRDIEQKFFASFFQKRRLFDGGGNSLKIVPDTVCKMARPACALLAVLLVASQCEHLPNASGDQGKNGPQSGSQTSNAGAATPPVVPPPHAPSPPLAADDVSWLFPAPVAAADMDNVIAIKDVTSPDTQDPTKRDPVWSDSAFGQFLSLADGPAGVVDPSNRIGLPAEVRDISVWQIAGIRIDAGAPGLADDIRAQFGQSPQIRLILHPVLRNANGDPEVQDIAAHLIFNFTVGSGDPPLAPGCLPRQKPDLVAFRQIVDEIAALRTSLANGDFGAPVSTAGARLGVHPGLANAATAARVKQEMKAFLERHISAARLSAMAVMGLPQGQAAPWIFVSMLRVSPTAYVAVPSPTLDGTQFAEMLTPIGSVPRVQPTPHTNNMAPITCRSATGGPASFPLAGRQGVATADIFAAQHMKAGPVQSIIARIDNPSVSHFFNTDCVSCHTATRLGMERVGATNIALVDPGVMPNGPYNVRNFGWSPPIEGPVHASTTNRTAEETQAVVDFINTKLAAE